MATKDFLFPVVGVCGGVLAGFAAKYAYDKMTTGRSQPITPETGMIVMVVGGLSLGALAGLGIGKRSRREIAYRPLSSFDDALIDSYDEPALYAQRATPVPGEEYAAELREMGRLMDYDFDEDPDTEADDFEIYAQRFTPTSELAFAPTEKLSQAWGTYAPKVKSSAKQAAKIASRRGASAAKWGASKGAAAARFGGQKVYSGAKAAYAGARRVPWKQIHDDLVYLPTPVSDRPAMLPPAPVAPWDVPRPAQPPKPWKKTIPGEPSFAETYVPTGPKTWLSAGGTILGDETKWMTPRGDPDPDYDPDSITTIRAYPIVQVGEYKANRRRKRRRARR